MKRILAPFYGALIVLSYLLIKVVTGKFYLLYFSVSCGLLFCIVLPFLKRPIPRPFAGVFIRGSMYAITNFLILAAQNKSTVSSSLASALIGSMLVSLPILLKPPKRLKNIIIVSCLFIGIFCLFDQITMSYLALISGLIQAITYASASKVMRVHQIPISWNLAMGFGMVSLLGLAVSTIVPIGNPSNLHLLSVLGVCAVILMSQLAFFQLYKHFSIESAGRYSLGRIPWSYFIEMIYWQRMLAIHIIFGIFFLTVGSFLRRERRRATR